jgi:hypothetical protein
MVQAQNADVPDQKDFTDTSPNPAADSDLAVVCDGLCERGIRRVVVRYEGCGDSGSIEEVEYMPKRILVPAALDDKLQDMAAEYCPDGYENNEGGYGTLTLYLRQGLAELEHFDRVEDTEDMGVASVPLPEELRAKLVQAGITGVTAHFDGYGDSGQIEWLTAEPEGATLAPELESELDGFLAAQLPEGYENNAGGFGDFTVNVAGGQVDVNATWRVESETAEVTRWKWRK